MRVHPLRSVAVLLLCYPLITAFSLFSSTYRDANKLYDEGKYEEALATYNKAMDNSDVDVSAAIKFKVGKMHLNGEGTKADPSKAVKLFEEVASSGSKAWKGHALEELAHLYRDGIGVQQNPQKALQLYEELTLLGNREIAARSYLQIGRLREKEVTNPVQNQRSLALSAFKKCIEIRPTEKSCAEAIELLKEYPDVFVEINPGEYGGGEKGIAPAGMEQAYKLFSKGKFAESFSIVHWHARNGNAEAQLEMARRYLKGIGIEKSPEIGYGWLFLSARNGNAVAQKELGIAISLGQTWGSTKDALFWLKAASDQGNAEAFNEMGRIWLDPVDETKQFKPDPKLAFSLISKGAELGSIVAITNLGYMYLNGIGVAADRETARQLFIKSAEAGDTNAKLFLLQHFGISSSPDKTSLEIQKKFSAPKTAEPLVTPSRGVDKVAERIIERPSGKSPEKPSPVDVFSKTSGSVFPLVAISATEKSQGSAVALTKNIAVTNCHVIKDMDAFAAKVGVEAVLFQRQRSSETKDVCIIASKAPMLPIGETRRFNDLKVGEKVFAIGSPLGLINTFSEGIISGLRHDKTRKLIQTTAPFTHGSSGGALLDEYGRLIGITTMVVKEANLNFAVSIDEVLEVVGTAIDAPKEKLAESPKPAPSISGDLRASVSAGIDAGASDRSVPEPQFASPQEKADWLTRLSLRLEKRIPDRDSRLDFLKTVYYEAVRAGLDPYMVLGVIEVSSDFGKYAVSSSGAVGYMQVSMQWKKKIGTAESNLLHMRTNLRFGCTILRHYLDIEKGDLYLALERYNAGEELGIAQFPNKVRAAWERWKIAAAN
jgi:TPR repeat protein